MPIEYNPENCVISVGVSDYDPDGTPWMLAQTLDVKAGRA
jgi:hypothetical protein